MRKERLKKLLNGLGSLLALGGVVFVGLRLREYSGAMDFSGLGTASWISLAACAVVYGCAGMLMVGAWRRILRHLAVPVPFLWAVRAYGVSQLAKYIPGNIFHFAGRQALGMAEGLPAMPLLRSTFWELALQLAAGSLFVFLALPAYWHGLPALGGVGLFLAAACVGLLLARRFVGADCMAAFGGHLVFLGISGVLFSIVLQVALGATEATGVVGGLGVTGAAGAGGGMDGASPETLSRFTICGAFVLAWLAGFVTPGAPAGAGVREMVLLFLFNGMLPEASLLLAVLLGRGVTVGGDLLFYLLACVIRPEPCVKHASR